MRNVAMLVALAAGVLLGPLVLVRFLPETGQPVVSAAKAVKAPPKEAVVEKPDAVPMGVDDKGIFGDLDGGLMMTLPGCAGGQDLAIVVNKKKRTLSLELDGVALKTYPVALGFSPAGDKVEQGDGRTPEGEYTLCEMIAEDLEQKYGARSMRLSYPSVKDAKKGLASGLITKAQHDAIVEAIGRGEMPPQDTRLGSSIRIHGGGVGEDWTAGCIALRDEDAIEIYDLVRIGTRVRVESGKDAGKGDADRDGIPDQVDVHAGALKCAMNGAAYDSGYYKISFPMGDVQRDRGCCSDVIIRALRNAGMDLQEMMRDDIAARPKSYPHIKKPNTDIDHRRVKNLLIYMRKHMRSIDADLDADSLCQWLPGDIVFLDTLPKKGPDHVGILTSATGETGLPMVVNNWTWGHTTEPMDLLSWVPVTHHFRLR